MYAIMDMVQMLPFSEIIFIRKGYKYCNIIYILPCLIEKFALGSYQIKFFFQTKNYSLIYIGLSLTYYTYCAMYIEHKYLIYKFR